MWRHKKKECCHVWKLRLTPMKVDYKYEWWRKPQMHNGTEMLYICIECGEHEIQYSRIAIPEDDLASIPQGEMIKRYKDALNENNTADSRDSCTTGDKD